MTKWLGLIVTAGIAIAAGAASAQGVYPRGGYGTASDLDGSYSDRPYPGRPYADRPYVDVPPYAGLPPDGPRPLPPRILEPRYGERAYDEPGYAPALLPPTAVYGILRDRGYSPLGIPQQRGLVYTISVISPEGSDGRLVIDARSGRILRFMPAYRMGDRMDEESNNAYGPVRAPPPIAGLGGAPRPPMLVPRVATRTPNVPLPKPVPPRAVASPAQPVAPKAAAATPPATKKPADAQASIPQPPAATTTAPVPAAPPAVIEAKPATPPVIQPTQDMPPAQGLE